MKIGKLLGVRNPRFFTPPQCRTKSYKDSFFPTVLDLWNKLGNDTRNIQSLSSFKIKLNEDVDESPVFASYVCFARSPTPIHHTT
jgi:hypothetical protein